MAKENLNALVFDDEGFKLEHIDEPEGRLWRYGKQWVYAMLRKSDGSLKPFELPKKLDDLPERLYRALYWDNETGILFMMKNTLMEKLSLFGTYILIGALLFFMYLIYSSI
jgi:hypothetical protein